MLVRGENVELREVPLLPLELEGKAPWGYPQAPACRAGT